MANSMTHRRNWRVLSTLPSAIKWNSVLFIQMIEDDNISLCTRASPSISSSHSVRCWLKKEFPFLHRDSSFCFCTLVLQEKVIDFCVISGSLEKHNTSLELKKAGAAVFYYHFSASFFYQLGLLELLLPMDVEQCVRIRERDAHYPIGPDFLSSKNQIFIFHRIETLMVWGRK